MDTVRYDFLVYNLIKAHRPVLLTGPVGTGKTSVAQGVLSRLDTKTYSILTVNMSAQVWFSVLGDLGLLVKHQEPQKICLSVANVELYNACDRI